MLKIFVLALASAALTANAGVLERNTDVVGENNITTGYAEGVISNVTNRRPDPQSAFIGCEIEAFAYTGDAATVARCSARLSDTGEDLTCFTESENQVQAIASLTDSSFVRFEFFGPFCSKVIVENGSQYGAKSRAVW